MRRPWYLCSRPVFPPLAAAALAAVLLSGSGCVPRDHDGSARSSGQPGTASSRSANAPESPSNSAAIVPAPKTDPARFAAQVRTHAAAAGIDPQLLMAILYNESYKPHDPASERAWHRLKPDCAFGVANMHEAAFTDAKRGRDFADRDWHELPDDPDLAIEAAAWYLHDLAAQLPASWADGYSRDELLALGYNAGAGNMLAFAGGAQPVGVTKDYLEKLRTNWPAAAKALTSS